MRRFITFGPALVVLLTAMVTLVAAPAAVRRIGYAGTEATIQLARQNLGEDNILKAIDRATRAIADAVEPSVVHISVRASQRNGWVIGSSGSGWVYDQAGHIVTNAHVAKGAASVMVQFQDGRAVPAKVVGVDTSTDIAVLKVDSSEGIFPASRASDVDLHQGDRVYAFGSPFGFKFSMSEGIVSGLGRDPGEIIGEGGFTNFIQTDAAVNPGNSGGPLVNVEGKVVGMNVAIATAPGLSGNGKEGQNSGISFAIPVATIESVVEQIIAGGVAAKGYLGVSRPRTDDENNRLVSMTAYKGRGVFVTDVPTDGPAGKAGLQPGDIITKINEQPAFNIASFRSLIANRPPGDKVKVDIWRQGEAQSLSVTLGTLPPSITELREVMQLVRNYGIVNLFESDSGLEIAQMVPQSRAVRDGVRPEQVITAVDGTKVTSVEQFVNLLAQRGLHQGRPAKITVDSANGQQRDIQITP